MFPMSVMMLLGVLLCVSTLLSHHCGECARSHSRDRTEYSPILHHTSQNSLPLLSEPYSPSVNHNIDDDDSFEDSQSENILDEFYHHQPQQQPKKRKKQNRRRFIDSSSSEYEDSDNDITRVDNVVSLSGDGVDAFDNSPSNMMGAVANLDDSDNDNDDDNDNISGNINNSDGSRITSQGNGNSTVYFQHEEAACPRYREEAATVHGRLCLRKCSSDADCISARKRCLCDGLCGWSCVRPDLACDGLKELPHGRYNLKGNFFNARVQYECDAGYFLSGVSERTCQGDSSWSDHAPECKTKPLCGPPPSIFHAMHSSNERNLTDVELNTTLQYYCFNGYEVQGTTEATCVLKNMSTHWSGPNMRCKAKLCGDPGEIKNGYKEATGYHFTSAVNYFCEPGYVMSGRAVRYCSSQGSWSGDLPTCQPIKCEQPVDPRNGRAFFDTFIFNSTVRYECEPGFLLIGPENRTCGTNRTWSGPEPECKVIDCGQPGPFPNGYIEFQSTSIDSVLNFFCFDGMHFVGTSNQSVCTERGVWSPFPFPSCMARCSIPSITNGKVLDHLPMTRVTHGHRINVTCIDNFELLHHDQSTSEMITIECHNGTWPLLPMCVPARCKQLPPKPRNGIVIAPKTNHGMRAVYRCRDGYRLDGPNSTWCHFGSWNITESPVCREIYCVFPGTIQNGKVLLVGHMGMYEYRSYVRRVVNNKQIMFECEREHHLEGPPGATCIDGQWSPPILPICRRFTYPRLSRRAAVGVDQDQTQSAFHDLELEDLSRSEQGRSLDLTRKKRRFDEVDDFHQELSPHELSFHDHPTTYSSSSLAKKSSQQTPQRHHKRRRRHPVLKSACTSFPDRQHMLITVVKRGKPSELDRPNSYPHRTQITFVCDPGYGLSNPNRTLAKCAKGRWKPEVPECQPLSCRTPTPTSAGVRLRAERGKKHRLMWIEPDTVVAHNQTLEIVCGKLNKQQRQQRQQRQQQHSITSFSTTSSNNNVELKISKCLFGVWVPDVANTSCSEVRQDRQRAPDVTTRNGNNNNRRSSSSQQSQQDDGPIGTRTVSGGSQVAPFCQSPEKIENALHYFGELLNRPMHLIGIAQFESNVGSGDDSSGSSSSSSSSSVTVDNKLQIPGESAKPEVHNSKNDRMAFQYENGTEIVFRCVNYGSIESYSERRTSQNKQQQQQRRSTWIIRCEMGNWIGRSFDCEDDILNQNIGATSEIASAEQPVISEEQDKILSKHHPDTACQLDDLSRMNVSVFHGQEMVENFKDSFEHDTILTIRCADIGRFQLRGPRELVCQNGKWSTDERPTCEGLSQEYNYDLDRSPTITFRNQFGPIAQTPDGRLLVYPGTILHLECLWKRKHGTPHWSWTHAGRAYQQYWTTEVGRDSSLEYHLTIFHAQERDSGVYTCQTPTSHSHSIEIVVKEVNCPSLANISANVRVEMSSQFGDRLNSQINFTCPIGTNLLGPQSAICLSSGEWSHYPPRCRVTECPDLTISDVLDEPLDEEKQKRPEVLQSGRKVGDKVVFACPRGYGLRDGDHEQHCGSNGQWSGVIPICEEVECSSPHPPERGFLDSVRIDRFLAGDIVQFGCETGFMLVGNPISICQENGRWSGPRSKCEPACTYPGQSHGTRLLSEIKFFYSVNETVLFECSDGYRMVGSSQIRCVDSGRWSGSIPQCEPFKV